jgi:hypothetical protein
VIRKSSDLAIAWRAERAGILQATCVDWFWPVFLVMQLPQQMIAAARNGGRGPGQYQDISVLARAWPRPFVRPAEQEVTP